MKIKKKTPQDGWIFAYTPKLAYTDDGSSAWLWLRKVWRYHHAATCFGDSSGWGYMESDPNAINE